MENNVCKGKDSNRGQVGVGTIIVFISMVLVAAIASAALITAVDQLQQQSSETSSQTEEQVSNFVRINNIFVGTPSGSNKVETIEAIHSLSPGSDPIDLKNVVWVIETGSDTETYNYQDIDSAVTGDPIDEVSSDIAQDTLLRQQKDRLKLTFQLTGTLTTGETESGITSDDGENGDGSTPIADGETVTISGVDETVTSETIFEIETVEADTGSGTVDTDVTTDFSIVNSNSGQIEYSDSGSGTLDEIEVTYTLSEGGLKGIDSVSAKERLNIIAIAPDGGQRIFGAKAPSYIDLSEETYRIR